VGIKKKVGAASAILFVSMLAYVFLTSPKGAMTISSTRVAKGEAMSFSGGNSTDPFGRIVSYEWDFGDGSRTKGINVEHSYAEGGIYTVKLTVTDDHGLSDTCEAEIEVVVTPPQPKITVRDTEVRAGETVIFDATDSRDPDGEILSYDWDFGDGATASGVVVEHIYEETRIYEVSLRAVDNDGLSNATKVRVQVKPVQYALAHAIDEGVVKARIAGLSSYNLLTLELERLVPFTVDIAVQRGTVFLATGQFPDMVHAGLLGIYKGYDLLSRSVKYEPTQEIVLRGNETKTYVLEVYCLGFYKSLPSSSSIYDVDGLADPSVMKILEAANELPKNITSFEAIQAAIWVATEDLSKFELMEGFEIQLEDIENAKVILETAYGNISIHLLAPPYDLVKAVDKGLIEVEFRGKDACAGDVIRLKIKPKLEVSIDIEIEPGLILINSGVGQNMIVAEKDTVTVKAEVGLELDIEAYCLDPHKDNPSTNETLTMQTDPVTYGEVVVDFMESLVDVPWDKKSVDAVQIALWVITDDITRDDIRIFFSEQDIEDAKWLLENAGIDISGKRLFQEG